MTTVTTVIGLLPLVLFPGAGSELYRGLGAVVLGGITVSTVFTLLLVPILFILMLETRELAERLVFGRQAAAIEPTKLPEQGPRPTKPQVERVYSN